MILELDEEITRTEYARNYYSGYQDCHRLEREAEVRLENLSIMRGLVLAYGE